MTDDEFFDLWHVAYITGDVHEALAAKQALELAVKNFTANNTTKPESITGSVPHRDCRGCPEYGFDKDCSGKCP